MAYVIPSRIQRKGSGFVLMLIGWVEMELPWSEIVKMMSLPKI